MSARKRNVKAEATEKPEVVVPKVQPKPAAAKKLGILSVLLFLVLLVVIYLRGLSYSLAYSRSTIMRVDIQNLETSDCEICMTSFNRCFNVPAQNSVGLNTIRDIYWTAEWKDRSIKKDFFMSAENTLYELTPSMAYNPPDLLSELKPFLRSTVSNPYWSWIREREGWWHTPMCIAGLIYAVAALRRDKVKPVDAIPYLLGLKPASVRKPGETSNHNVLKAFAVLSMLSDHFGRVWPRKEDAWYTVGSQYGAAHLFYFMAGQNSASPAPLGTARIWLAWLFLFWVVTPPDDTVISFNTLTTIAFIRVVWPYLDLPRRSYNFQLSLITIFWTLSPLIDYEAIKISYGVRSFFYAGAAAVLPTDRLMGTVWFLSGLGLSLLLNLFAVIPRIGVNLNRLTTPGPRELAFLALCVYILVLHYLLYNFRFRKFTTNPLLAKLVNLIADYSLTIYIGHLVFFKWWRTYLHPDIIAA